MQQVKLNGVLYELDRTPSIWSSSVDARRASMDWRLSFSTEDEQWYFRGNPVSVSTVEDAA